MLYRKTVDDVYRKYNIVYDGNFFLLNIRVVYLVSMNIKYFDFRSYLHTHYSVSISADVQSETNIEIFMLFNDFREFYTKRDGLFFLKKK